ncbi:signal peptidase II [bacterium]|nr:signal peptidase II [bacterium]
MRTRLAFWLPATLGLVADLVSKSAVFKMLESVEGRRLPLLGRWLVFQVQRNHGGVFGILQGKGYIFVILSIVALGAVLWMLKNTRPEQIWMRVALGLVVAGALGNLYDRIVFGHVRDFIYVEIINYPAFNVADMCICTAAGMLIIEIIREGIEEKRNKNA